jgi:TolB-like protein
MMGAPLGLLCVLESVGLIFRFENCSLDTERRELRCGGVVQRVEPQVFDLLEYLIGNRQRVVSKDEILKAIWHGRIVSEATLYTRINAARRAIGDSGSEQRLLCTLRSKGLRFVGEVREEAAVVDATLHPAKDAGLQAILGEHPAIAVLPFSDLCGDSRQEGLADAFTEDVIAALARTDWLWVVSRTSSFACKDWGFSIGQLAHKLRVRYLVEGGIRVLSGRVRITVRLVDGLSDHHLWAERYDRSAADIAAVLDDIIDNIVAAIGSHLLLAEQLRAERKSPEHLSRWECIVRALSLVNSRERSLVGLAQKLVEKAVVLDPQSARIHSLLSFITTLGVHQGWQRRELQIPLALRMARKALSLSSEDAWAHLSRGYAMIWVQPEDAVADLQMALRLNPNLATAHYLIALASAWAGRGEQALEHANMAEALNSRDLLARGNAGTHNNVRATACFAMGRYQEGREFARKAIADSPRMPTAHRAFLINSSLAGNVKEAAAALKTALVLAPDLSQRWIKETAAWARSEDQRRYLEAFRTVGLR